MENIKNAKYTVPILHRNGSSRDVLEAQLRKVSEKLREAKKAIDEAWPNGRDYYVSPVPNAMRKAEAEWASRRDRVAEVLTEVETLRADMLAEWD